MAARLRHRDQPGHRAHLLDADLRTAGSPARPRGAPEDPGGVRRRVQGKAGADRLCQLGRPVHRRDLRAQGRQIHLHGAEHARRQRLRGARRLHLHHPRPARARQQRGGAGERAGPRDRPHHRAPHGGAHGPGAADAARRARRDPARRGARRRDRRRSSRRRRLAIWPGALWPAIRRSRSSKRIRWACAT